GSTFTLSIEAGAIDSVVWAPLAMTSKPAQQSRASDIRLKGHILVVDDLPDIRFLVGEIISNAGARVSYAANGEEALSSFSASCARGEPFDLVIMDMQMPGMDGLTACAELRKLGCQSPVLALTAATMQGEKERCLTAGCDDYLSKPVEESALLGCVKKLLGSDAPLACALHNDKRGRVLLVEDNHDARQATRQILELLGWQVMDAASGQEARQLVQNLGEKTPHIALVDVNLPDADGYELIRELRQSSLPTTRFITLSGYAGD